MACIFMDGFDWYASADVNKRWTDGGSQTTIGVSYARNAGGQGAAVGCTNVPALYKSFGSNYTQGCVGLAFWSSNSQASRIGLVKVIDGTTEQISVRTNGSSVLTVTRNGTVLATGTTVLSTSTWYYIELKFTIHASAGVVELKLNGAAEIASTGSLNTRNTANTQWNGVQFGVQNSSANAAQYDDIYVLDTSTGSNTTFLGPIQVVARYPNGNGNYAQWTPNGGSNMGCVAEQFEDGDVGFNQSSTANQIDTYGMQDLPVAAGSVFAIAQYTVARQDGGAARSLAPLFRISGTDYVGATVSTSTSYQFFSQVYDNSPATAASWTVSEANGVESGYKLIS